MTFKPTDYLPYDFANRRHIGPSPQEMTEMLEVVADMSDQGLRRNYFNKVAVNRRVIQAWWSRTSIEM